MHSIFGLVTLRRSYFYSPADGLGRFPLDEALGLVESFSPALVRLASRAAAREGYQAASDDLLALGGISIEPRQIHRLVDHAGPLIDSALQQGQLYPAQPIPVLYVEIDATGVPMVASELEGRKGKQADGRSKTREIKLGCVFTQTRPDPETGAPVRDPDSTSYCGSFEPAETFGARIRHEAQRRGMGGAQQVVLLGDGAAWIWELARVNFPTAIWIVDLYHALERLHKLTQSLYPDGTAWAARMGTEWKQMLKNDQVEEVIAAARRRLEDLPGDEEIEKQIGYFENQKSRMLYKTYREKGLFCGSGVIEAGCKSVIGERIKQSGMFWTVLGASCILTLRCALKSNRWDECWDRAQSPNYLKIRIAA
jgi:hypothetical protein